MTDIILTVPARHLIPGDHTGGFVVSTKTAFPDGTLEFKFVVPFTSAYTTVLVQERHLDGVLFPLTKRGDDYSPNARNAALGLPPVPPKVYVKPEPVHTYPAGTKVKDIKHFDRSQHLLFACPEHPTSAWSSKDPTCSSIFPQSDQTLDCTITRRCHVSVYDYVLTHEYAPTRNG